MADKMYHLWLLIATAVLVQTIDAQGLRPTDVTVVEGQQVMINCSGTDVSWFFGLKKLFKSPDTWQNQDNKYGISGQYHLVITDTNAGEDAGQYMCNTDEVPGQLLSANLLVIESMSLTVEPSGYVDRGDTIKVSCAVRYGAPVEVPVRLSDDQHPTVTVVLDNTRDFPTATEFNEQPTTGKIYTRTMFVNYTLTDASPGRYLRCRVRSLSFEAEMSEMLQIKFAPEITANFAKEYNTTDNITCSAKGVPDPRVTWTHVAGDMDKAMRGLTGTKEAVLMNLKSGTHTWLCTATNEIGTDSENVTFTVSGAQTEEVAGEPPPPPTTTEATTTEEHTTASSPGNTAATTDCGDKSTIIGLSVALAVQFAAIIILVIVVIVQRRRVSKSFSDHQSQHHRDGDEDDRPTVADADYTELHNIGANNDTHLYSAIQPASTGTN